MSSFLEALQDDITAKLSSEAFYANIAIYSVRKLQIESDINTDLVTLLKKGGKLGCGVLVGMPTVGGENPNAPGPQSLVTLPIRIHEDPLVNLSAKGTLKSAEEVGLDILETLHGFRIEGVGSLYTAKTAMVPNTEFEGLVTYDLYLTTFVPRSGREKAITPSIAEAALTVTFTNLTPGATIYYTTDGKMPGSGNATAQIYTAPFLFAGTKLRWAAYKAGMIGSDVGEAIIA